MENPNHSPEAYEIVFNDEYLLVVNKIAKILVQPAEKKDEVTLTSLLQKESGEDVFPCHRLDRETTGLVIYAKSAHMQEAITQEFKRGEVKKRYIAFVKDSPKKRQGLLEDYIIDSEGKKFGEKPKKAKTFYAVLKKFNNWSVLELEPVTGRTNQLRIQLAKIGSPILGERKYAFGRDFLVKFRRLALHDFYLNFIHPVSRDRVELKIDLPQDMKKFLRNQP